MRFPQYVSSRFMCFSFINNTTKGYLFRSVFILLGFGHFWAIKCIDTRAFAHNAFFTQATITVSLWRQLTCFKICILSCIASYKKNMLSVNYLHITFIGSFFHDTWGVITVVVDGFILICFLWAIIITFDTFTACKSKTGNAISDNPKISPLEGYVNVQKSIVSPGMDAFVQFTLKGEPLGHWQSEFS